MADKIPKVISNATVIKVLAKVFAFQAIEISLLRSHAGISDANWKALNPDKAIDPAKVWNGVRN